MEIQPHDQIIARLKKDLVRREEKLRNKPTTWHKKQRNITRDLLKQWEAEREEKIKSQQ